MKKQHIVRKLKIARYYIEYIIVKFIFWVFGFAKIQKASNLCALIARPVVRLICKINGRHAKAIENLTLCFPEKTCLQKEQIMDKFYENVGRFVGEFITQNQMDEKWFAENVEIINPEILDENFKTGFFGITGHFGNWELLHKYLAIKGERLNIIYRRQNNEFIEKAFIDSRPVNQIPKGSNAMRDIMGFIKNKKIVGILIDQRDNAGERFPFFGRGARTGTAIQRLSLKYDYKMICVKIVRRNDDPNKFILHAYKPLEIKKTGDVVTDINLLTQKTLDMLEDWIKENPEQWFWMYDRWK